MKTIKRSIIFSTSFVLLLSACGDEEENTGQDIDETEVEAPDETEDENGEDPGDSDEASNGDSDEMETDDENDEDDPDENEEVAEDEPFDEEEMRDYIRSLSDNPDAVDDRALDQLELRGIHANTELYEGRMDPNNIAYYWLPDGEGGHLDEMIEIEPNEEGYFTLAFPETIRPDNLQEGETIRLMVVVPGQHREDDFFLPVHEEEPGMEVIESHTASQEVKEGLAEEIEFDYPIYSTGFSYGSTLHSDTDKLAVDFQDQLILVTGRGTDSSYDFEFSFTGYPTAGEFLTFYIPYDGYILPLEQEVMEPDQEAVQAIQDATTLPESFHADDLEEPDADHQPNRPAIGETIPNAMVFVSREVEESGEVLFSTADEDGRVEIPFHPDYPREGELIWITIRDENGVTETFEVEVE